LDVTFLTIHTAGGLAMMKAAKQAAKGQVDLLGVTVLTSLAEDDLRADGVAGSMRDAVVRRAKLAAQAGITGVVCSPQEVADVCQACPSLLLVVPGVRPAGGEVGDQKRVATPASAIAAGAGFLVVGRPIRDAKSPAAAFSAVVDEVATALPAGK
jgi:orotidine-5'-phosphate decarboxylase